MGWYKFDIPLGEAVHGRIHDDFSNGLLEVGLSPVMFNRDEMALYSEKHGNGTTYYVSPEMAKLDALIEKWNAKPCAQPNLSDDLSFVLGTEYLGLFE